MHTGMLKETDFSTYLNKHEKKDCLRFITCGSVDDGKSTLIGRLLYESNLIYEDQLKTLIADSKKLGTPGMDLDFALLVDGLASEREQGITIDVAYRFFSTVNRRFIVADTPGHEQYTGNMATGASTADVAIVLVDARKGILTQTKRHSFIVSLFGVRHIVLAVNKMDLVGYEQEVFQRIEEEFRQFADSIDVAQVTSIPVSALCGDNIVNCSPRMFWYRGLALLPCLEEIKAEPASENESFCMPVQWVNRAHADFRGYTGRVLSGQIETGNRIKVLPSGQETRVGRILVCDEKSNQARAGQSITLTFSDEFDVGRGDVLVAADSRCKTACQLEATLLWLSEKPMITGRQYLMKTGTSTVFAMPRAKCFIDINTLEHLPAKELALNEVGRCEIALDKTIAFTPYALNRELGSFILIERMTNATVAAGLIDSALNRSVNVFQQNFMVNETMRCVLKSQRAAVIWLTGLSGAGKSTIANLVEQRLHALGLHTMLLDGDNIRHGLNRDLSFSEAGRAENIRRIAEVAKLMTQAGLITLVSCISPYAAEREMARDLIGAARFFEIFIDAPLQLVKARDPKGLYQKVRQGEIKHFTGIDSPYEKPIKPDLRLDTAEISAEGSVEQLMDFLRIHLLGS